MKKLSSQKGFAVIESLLVVIILAMIAGIGYYVWHTNQQTKATLDAASKSAASSPQKITNKPLAKATAQVSDCGITQQKASASWKTFTDTKYKYGISYPSDWDAAQSGGAENNSSHTPILTELLFTPPGNQGPQYGIEVTAQSLTAATRDWENSVKEAQANNPTTTYVITYEKSCLFDGHPAERIDTKQSDSAFSGYDGEFYVVANSYSYKFSTGYGSSSDPFKTGTSMLLVIESLNVLK